MRLFEVGFQMQSVFEVGTGFANELLRFRGLLLGLQHFALFKQAHAQVDAAGKIARMPTAKIHGFANTAVHRRRGICGQPHWPCSHALAPNLAAKLGIASHYHGDEIRHRRSSNKKSGCGFWKAEDRLHPARDLTLDLDGNLIAAAEIGVQSRRQHFRKHANGSAAAVDPAHETRMNVARREGQDVLHELLMDFGERRRLKW